MSDTFDDERKSYELVATTTGLARLADRKREKRKATKFLDEFVSSFALNPPLRGNN